MSDRRILVIDDEAGLRHTLLLILRDEGYDVHVADDGETGLRMALAEPPEIVLCDIRMPRMGGLDFLREYQAAGGTALVVMMSAYGSLDTAVEAMRQGAYDYISKPFNADEILLTLRKAEEREQDLVGVERLGDVVVRDPAHAAQGRGARAAPARGGPAASARGKDRGVHRRGGRVGRHA